MARHRKSQAPKAWGRDSPNPITGRTSATSNGVQAPSKNSSSPKLSPTPNANSNSPDKEHDQLIFVLASLVVSIFFSFLRFT